MTRRLRLVGAGILVTAAVGACSAQAPDWSLAPASPRAASASGSPVAPGGATVVDLAAQNIAFDRTSLTAAANTPLTIRFDNRDQGVGHDVTIHQGSADGKLEFQGDVIVGPATVDYRVPALPPGRYEIICIVHPTQMVATLTVG